MKYSRQKPRSSAPTSSPPQRRTGLPMGGRSRLSTSWRRSTSCSASSTFSSSSPTIFSSSGHLPSPPLLGCRRLVSSTQRRCSHCWPASKPCGLCQGETLISFSSYVFLCSRHYRFCFNCFFFQLMLQVAHGQWNHLDFLWGRDVRTLLYDQMLAVSILFVNFENCKLFELLP